MQTHQLNSLMDQADDQMNAGNSNSGVGGGSGGGNNNLGGNMRKLFEGQNRNFQGGMGGGGGNQVFITNIYFLNRLFYN